jgi:hypothetical protein
MLIFLFLFPFPFRKKPDILVHGTLFNTYKVYLSMIRERIYITVHDILSLVVDRSIDRSSSIY